MDWITFGSNVIDSVTWPLAIVIVVYWLKGHIKELLPFVRKVRIGNTELEFAEMIERKANEKVEGVEQEAHTSVNAILDRQEIQDENIKTLRDEINDLVSDTVQKARQAEKDARTELVCDKINGLVRSNPHITQGLVVNLLDEMYGFHPSEIMTQVFHMVNRKQIISSDGNNLYSGSFLTIPVD